MIIGLGYLIYCLILTIFSWEIKDAELIGNDAIKEVDWDPPKGLLAQNEIYYEKVFNLTLAKKNYLLCVDVDEDILSKNIIAQFDMEDALLFRGHICGHKNSYVLGSIVENAFYGEIVDQFGERYYFEDVVKHKKTHKCQNCRTLMYNAKEVLDFEKNLTRTNCGISHDHNNNFMSSKEISHETIKKFAATSGSSTGYICEVGLHLHKDYLGQYSSKASAISQIGSHFIELNDRLDKQISPMKSGGLLYHISKVSVFGSGDDEKFKNFRTAKITLESSSAYLQSEGRCLTGVYVNKDWDRVLGLAYVGRSDGIGICNNKANYVITYQVNGQQVSYGNHKITTIHEIGHNLGSDHDPSNECGSECDKSRISECSPTDNYYLMAPYASDGSKRNNYFFSPCSVEAIKKIIGSPARRTCLLSTLPSTCGNGVIEAGEECDSGLDNDPCCGAQDTIRECKIIKGQCSPSQGQCCIPDTCSIRSIEFVCSPATDCSEIVRCNGTSPTCQNAAIKPDGSECSNKRGSCLGGQCSNSPCILFNKDPCLCTNITNCTICCANKNDASSCSPQLYDNKLAYYPEGFFCGSGADRGICLANGECKVIVSITPLINAFKFILSGQLGEKIKGLFFDYIEFIVIALSLFIFFFSIISRFFDVDHEKKLLKLINS